jgi:hypothetical protein
MPVWGQVISTHQVADLVAYIRADLSSVPGATPPPVITGQGSAVEGALLYQRYGCVNCHGPNGLGVSGAQIHPVVRRASRTWVAAVESASPESGGRRLLLGRVVDVPAVSACACGGGAAAALA